MIYRQIFDDFKNQLVSSFMNHDARKLMHAIGQMRTKSTTEPTVHLSQKMKSLVKKQRELNLKIRELIRALVN
jgi:replication fork clamp-binding protein CrfC